MEYIDKAIFLPSGQVFALKFVKLDNKGVEINSYREIEILMTLDHPGVVKLLSVIQSRKGIYLVLEYGGYDLAYQYDILNQHLNEFQIKQLSRSLLEVLSYMHQNNIIHRDLKLSNILISSTNKLKLCDFGLSKILESTMTSGVATLWYRAPELLFEDSNYDTSIDMWSFGCIFAELLNKGKPVLPGKSPSGQLDLISGLIGPPSLSIWPGFAKFSSYIPPSDCHNTLQVKFQEYSSECVDFLNSLLVWDPAERLTAAEALMSSYLKSCVIFSMVRLALISKHIVLTDCFGDNFFAYPQPGAVLIEDSFISDVILEKDVMMLGLLRERLRDWEIVDYSEFYISPGVIDLNTRAEWEDISELTREAVNSGTTLIVVEPGYYHHQDSSKALHCDIFKVSVLQDGLFSEVDPNFPTVLKAYLFPPAPNVKSISNLQHILQTCSNSKHPFFIDATMPDPRMLYMASPLRLEEVSDRKTAEKSSFSYFASAFSQEGQESDEEEEEDQSSSFPLRSGSLPMGSQWVMPSKDSGQGTLKEISPVSPHEFPLIQNKDSTKRNSQQLNNIYDGLDIRISQSKVNQEDLFRAETSTYSYSGQTNYGGLKKTSSGSELPGLESLRSFSSEISRQSNLLSLPKTGPGQGSNSPEPSGIAGRIGIRGRNLNLAPLNTCKTPTTSSSSDYNHHLANIPVDWETSGVSKVLESISGDSKVHFCGLSSSASLNLIRKAKASKKVTCEITAVNLCFTSECIENGNTRFKNNPPVRNYSNNLLLWDLLKMKGIDLISSGHASIVPDMKLTGNFQTAYSGIAGLGCTLQSVWYILNKPVSTRQLLEHYIVRLAKWTSLHPAEVLRVSHQRGSIKKGKFADLVVWDPWEKYKLGSDFKYSATSPFVGVELLGKIKQVYFKGSPKLQL